MTRPPSIEEHVARYTAAIRAARASGDDVFQRWFDDAGGADAALVRGAWDFAVHILTPAVCARVERPEELVALEIGYGGGRLVHAACGFFREVVGVDIHEESDAVAAVLRGRGRDNFRLLTGSGVDLPVADASVDFVYSFIVLQHLPTWESFERYVAETARCLKPGGVAQLYFGRLGGRRSRLSRTGYLVLPDAEVNHTSLRVTTGAIRRLAAGLGLDVVDTGRSWKHVPDGYGRQVGDQSYATLIKG